MNSYSLRLPDVAESARGAISSASMFEHTIGAVLAIKARIYLKPRDLDPMINNVKCSRIYEAEI